MDAVLDDLLHLHLMPVAGVGDQQPGVSVTPTAASSFSAASQTEPSNPEAGELTEISAAITTCPAVTAACAL